MDLMHILLSFWAGSAYFLFGMKLMGDGLELVAGSRLRSLLEEADQQSLLGVLVGRSGLVTGAIQSSSATTVMVVGFLNAGLLKLEQAVYVIMGANIGTTVTSFLIGLKISYLAPIAVFAGIMILLMIKKKLIQHIGMVIIGFGILFTGMESMSGAMKPLAQMPEFASLMTKFSNPVLGILAGAVLPLLSRPPPRRSASFSAGRQRRGESRRRDLYPFRPEYRHLRHRAACLHRHQPVGKRAAPDSSDVQRYRHPAFYSDLPVFPYVELIEGFVADPKMQISVAHIIFNIVSTAVLLPFAQLLVKLAQKLIPGKDAAYEELRLQFLDERILNTPAIAVAQVTKEVERMAAIARNNFGLAMEVFFKPNRKPCNRSNRTSRCSIFSITASQAIW